ncbi:ATP-dependent DNA helicase [Achromobacter sp. GG226]|nr:ATP-dependent DNA helicase [Verticiella sp. GG226]
MAEAVAETLADGGTLVAEAGTGTGKTYAYLAPALLRGGKVLISTGTKTLQDQLFARDLPQLVAAMQMPAQIALLKGRGNYLCHLHLERTEADPRALGSREEVVHMGHIRRFAKRTQTGDIAELAEVPDNASVWGKVTSTRDTCLGQECGFYRDCFVVKARKAALEAEVVVVNHALFLADLALKDDGVAELLPRADCVVFDEAHQLPAVATRFLGETVSTHQLLDITRDTLTAGLAHARESADWVMLTQPVEQAARELRLACAAIERLPGQKSAFDALPDPGAFDAAVQSAADALGTLGKVVNAVRERHPDFELLARRVPDLFAKLRRWLPAAPPEAVETPAEGSGATSADGAASAWDEDELTRTAQASWAAQLARATGQAPAAAPADTGSASARDAQQVGKARSRRLARRASAQLDLPGTPPAPARAAAEDNEDWVLWVETQNGHVRLQAAPLSVAKAFSRYRPPGQAWILTSATLAVRNDFTHFTRQLGLWEARTGQWESPFDYANCGRLFVPHGIPAPDQPGFTESFVETLLPLIGANQGSALVLCTTLRAVDTVHRLLSEGFAARGWTWPLYRQGEKTRRELLAQLRSGNHAVLVGSASFWEGIDVPGDALTLVAIDKLPFAPPDDPVIEARIKASRKRGGNPFFEFQLPQAAIALKQGAGRLIRAESDWGVLMVADRRIVEKPYGKLLWRGLPPFGRTRSGQDVLAFLEGRRPVGEA